MGTDLSANTREWPVSNLSLIQHDAEKENWDFGGQLDYVHLSFVVACFASTKTVFQKAYDSLKPGGYIEICESEFTPQSDDDSISKEVSDMFALVRKASAAIGGDMSKVLKYVPWLEEVGFVDIHDKLVKWPLSPWAKHPIHKEVGWRQLANSPKVFASMGKLMEMAGIEEAVFKEVQAKGHAGLNDTACHPWMPWYVPSPTGC